jgi:hypothetical protein
MERQIRTGPLREERGPPGASREDRAASAADGTAGTGTAAGAGDIVAAAARGWAT